MAMRSPEYEKHRPVRDLLRRLIKAPAALSIIWPALLVVGGYLAWHRWGADHVAGQFYGVDPALIRVTEPPPYVRTDIVASTYHNTGMESLSLLEPQATAKIAAAFLMNNPWVSRVVSVRKLPGGVVDVHLQYRKPVAMVLVEKPNEPGDWFVPVDGEGVLLPTDQFAKVETLQFIHITVPGLRVDGRPAGTLFGDARVEAAAKLAAVLTDFREKADIVRIEVPGDPRLNAVPQLELVTSEERTRFWGSPPGMEAPGEDTVEMKLQALLNTDAAEDADLRMARRVDR